MKITKEQFLNLYDKKMSDVEIARALNVTPPTVWRWRKKLGLPFHKKGRVALRFDELYNQGLNDTEIARIIGVDQSTIWYYRHRQNLKTNPSKYERQEREITCECGTKFKSKSNASKYCEECRQINRKRYFEVRNIRWTFAKLARDNPDLAQKIQNEMIAEEGIEFKDLALDGILEKRKCKIH